MTDVLDAPVTEKPPEALAKLERLRRYFKSRFAMWDQESSDRELFLFSLVRERYPGELTAHDLKSVEGDFQIWNESGHLPEHVLAWYQVSVTDLMHLPR